MLTKRLTLVADTATAFAFDRFESNFVLVKNETPGAILFCDGPFSETEAAHIPAYSWQAFNVRVYPTEEPKFYVRADEAGDVEIDFGSSRMGTLHIPEPPAE